MQLTKKNYKIPPTVLIIYDAIRKKALGVYLVKNLNIKPVHGNTCLPLYIT